MGEISLVALTESEMFGWFPAAAWALKPSNLAPRTVCLAQRTFKLAPQTAATLLLEATVTLAFILFGFS